MKRRIAIIRLILGGAIVNVAVAWILSVVHLDSQQRMNPGPITEESMRWWRKHAPSGFAEPDVTLDRHGFGYRDARFTNLLIYVAPLGHRMQRGWPMLSLEWSKWDDFWEPAEVRYALEIPFASNDDDGGMRVPLLPVYPGFIINTLFYALLFWLLFFAPFAARRMLRRRRGQCEKCAYPIGTSPVCTECGAAVRRS